MKNRETLKNFFRMRNEYIKEKFNMSLRLDYFNNKHIKFNMSLRLDYFNNKRIKILLKIF